jgi:Ankyrin repeats (3 copies)
MNVFKSLESKDYDKIIFEINKEGFDIDATDERGFTLLMQCCSVICSDSEQKIIDLLLQKNANVNIQDPENQYNALMYSFEINRFEVSKKLLPLTDIEAVNTDGRKILTLAVYHGRRDLIELVCMTAQSTEDVEKLRKHLIYPNHSLTPYAHEFLDKIAFSFELENNLENKTTISKKPKI